MVEHCRIVIMVLRSAICRGQYTLRDIRPECAHPLQVQLVVLGVARALLADIPVHEGALGVHEVELVVHEVARGLVEARGEVELF